MKKTIILTLSCLLLAGCGGEATSSLSRKSIPSEPSITSEETGEADTSEEEGLTSEQESTSEAKPTTVSDLTPDRYNEFLPLFFAKRNSYQSYLAVTEGKTASMLDQSIDVQVIKGPEYSYLYNHSKSFLLETSHLCYYHGQKTLFKDNGENDFHLLSLNEYLDIYGVYPFESSLEGYDCSPEMIKSIEKVETGEVSKFAFTFDTENATTNVRIQMKKFGGLDDYPNFSSIKVTVGVKDDFTPVTIEVDAEYKAKMIFEVDCHQTYTVTYSRFDEDIEIPNLSEAKNHEGF